MNPINFKSEWKPDKLFRWWGFNHEKVNELPILEETKQWLKVGLPEGAAPFLNFGLRSYDGKFYTIAEYYSDYELNPKANNYWIIGSDGCGNPICIDSSDNDSILLLDHEQEFEVIGTINSKVSELAQCLLEYRRFINSIQTEFGDDAFIEAKFNKKHVDELKKRFEKIKEGLLLTSDFWNSEIESLYYE